MKHLINQLLCPGVVAALILSMSCTRRDLEIPPTEGAVNISFDWQNLYSDEDLPSGMGLYFYRNDGVTETRNCTSGGYTGTLPNGTYQVLAHNTDATGVAYRNMDTYTGAQAYATSETKATYLLQPLHAYGIGLQGTLTITGESEASATITPVSFVRKAVLKIILTGEQSAVASCVATLNGVVETVNISTGELQEETGTIAFTPSSNANGFESAVTFFGRVPGANNELTLIFNFTGGGSQTVTIDITAALENVNTAVIPIEVNANIEISGSVAGEFQATLKDWSYTDKSVTVKQ